MLENYKIAFPFCNVFLKKDTVLIIVGLLEFEG